MIDFLICYEHVNREVENDTLIKYELERRGYTCEIIPFSGPGFARFCREKARVVVTPWLRYDENVFHYLQMAGKPSKLVNLQWEQVYSDFDIRNGLVVTSGCSLSAKHLCWGEHARQRLLRDGAAPQNLYVTGAIQMDYGRPRFHAYYHSRRALAEEYGLAPERPWHLLISSFAYANYGEENIAALEAQFHCSMAELVQVHRDSQRLTLDWIEEFLKAHPDEFIYRPHPLERDIPRLAEMEAAYPNFHVISKYSVKQWAIAADRNYLWISTSLAEIAAMGRACHILRPLPIPPDLEVENMHELPKITTLEGFLAAASADTDGECLTLASMEPFYHYDFAVPAYIRVADTLEQTLCGDSGQTYRFTLRQRLVLGQKELRKRVVSEIMERQEAQPERNLIDSLPLKPIIRENLHKGITKHQDGQAAMARMLTYMKQTEPSGAAEKSSF